MIKFIGTAQNQQEVLLFYLQKEGEHTFLKVSASDNGLTFSDTNAPKYAFLFDRSQKEEQQYDWESFRVAKQHDNYILTFKPAHHKALGQALSPNMSVWYETGNIDAISHTGAIVPLYQHKDSFVMYVGGENIHIAYSKDLHDWKVETDNLFPPTQAFGTGEKEVANAYLVDGKILLLYYSKNAVGAAYFDYNNPSSLLWKSEEPVYELPDELSGRHVKTLGSALLDGKLFLYWLVDHTTVFSVSLPIPDPNAPAKKDVYFHIVKKFHNNPIISPQPHVPWESRATFNSAAMYEDGKVHFLYRALGDTDLSVLGYATSSDGLNLDYRSPSPAYFPREPFETPGNHAFSNLAAHFVSGGGYGGIEDPRITRVDNTVYLTYVAFDGATPPRVAISSIDIADFVANKWDKWSKPKLISAPHMVNKSAVMFPKRIRGKYVMMHRVYPNILMDYLDDLEFKDYLKGDYFIPPRYKFWDSKKVGAGAPPLETEDGWLLIYQSVGYQDSSRYKIGAMMLDRNRPEKVLYRTHAPIIEPVESYENNGFKAGVVYPCGAVVMNNTLNIYYGGADSYVNAAQADLPTFLSAMKRHREPKLQMVQMKHN